MIPHADEEKGFKVRTSRTFTRQVQGGTPRKSKRTAPALPLSAAGGPPKVEAFDAIPKTRRSDKKGRMVSVKALIAN